MKDTRRIPDPLVRALRGWAERPPALPAHAARQRVRVRLATRGRARRPAVGAAVLLATAAAAALVVRAPQPRLAPAPVLATEPSGLSVIVFELPSGTYLYFAPARGPRTGVSS